MNRGRWLRIVAFASLMAAPPIAAQTPPPRRAAGAWRVPRTSAGRPDLQGIWTNMTATPLQRPRELGEQSHFTRDQATEYERTWMTRLIEAEDEEDRTGADLNDIYLDSRTVVPDLRTSLIVERGQLRGRRGAARRARRGEGRQETLTLSVDRSIGV